MSSRVLFGCLALALSLPLGGCDCGQERHHARGASDGGARDGATAPAPAPEPPAEPAPPPPAEAAQPQAPRNERFRVASVTFKVTGGQRRAEVAITLPEGASIPDGTTQTAAVYFDNGPPIAAPLTLRAGVWHTAELRLPAVVDGAERMVMRIPTVPQTTFVWEMAGAWRNAAQGPVTLDSGN